MNILIIDDNQGLCDILCDYFSGKKDHFVCGVAHDGLQGLKLIHENKPDLIILDMILPKIDGLGVLEELEYANIVPKPVIVILSVAGQEAVIKRAMSLGADYYVLKPMDMNVFAKRITEILNNDSSLIIDNPKTDFEPKPSNQKNYLSADLTEQITDIMCSMKIPSNLKGFKYIREAVCIVLNDYETIFHVAKKLYVSIARKYSTTSDRVERSIRYAIEVAWTRTQADKIKETLEPDVDNRNEKPSNSELIALIAEKVKLLNKSSETI